MKKEEKTKKVIKEAKEVVIAPLTPKGERIEFGMGIDAIVRKCLLNRSLTKNDEIIVPGIAILGNALPFLVIDTKPKGKVSINNKTIIKVKEESVTLKTGNIDVFYELGKISVDGYYDYQQIRIAQMSRIRDVIRRKIEGIPYDKPEDKKEDKKFENKFKDENLSAFLHELVETEKITKMEKDYIEKLYGISKETSKTEERYKILMSEYLNNEELWNKWLIKIKGISSVLGSNLIKNFGYCETYQYVSSLWRHCGFDPDGAKGRKKGEKIHYNPKLKTLCWKIGDSFVKQRTQPYRKIYDNEKIRQLKLMENEAENAPKNKLHADLRARRKMVKIFLQHYYLVGRTLKKIAVTKPYPHDKMGHKHFIPPPHCPFDVDKIL